MSTDRPIAIVLPVQRPVAVLIPAQRGPRGPSGESLDAISFSFGDASPRVLHQLDETALLVSVQLIIATPFDGDEPALEIRTDTGDVLLSSDQNAPGFAGIYESTPAVRLLGGSAITLSLSPGAGATAGSGFVVLNLN